MTSENKIPVSTEPASPEPRKHRLPPLSQVEIDTLNTKLEVETERALAEIEKLAKLQIRSRQIDFSKIILD